MKACSAEAVGGLRGASAKDPPWAVPVLTVYQMLSVCMGFKNQLLSAKIVLVKIPQAGLKNYSKLTLNPGDLRNKSLRVSWMFAKLAPRRSLNMSLGRKALQLFLSSFYLDVYQLSSHSVHVPQGRQRKLPIAAGVQASHLGP